MKDVTRILFGMSLIFAGIFIELLALFATTRAGQVIFTVIAGLMALGGIMFSVLGVAGGEKQTANKPEAAGAAPADGDKGEEAEGPDKADGEKAAAEDK